MHRKDANSIQKGSYPTSYQPPTHNWTLALNLEEGCHVTSVQPTACSKGMVMTVSSWVVKIKWLLFVLCTVIISLVGEQKGATLDPWPTHSEREEGVFLVPHKHGSEQTENGSIVLPPPGFTKLFREKQNLVVRVISLFSCIDSAVIKLFVPGFTLHGNASMCTEEEFTSHRTRRLTPPVSNT